MVNKDKSYLQAYFELEKVARQIAVGFIIFLTATLSFAVAEYELFYESILKGGVVALLAVPIAHWHYGDEFNYKFKDL